MPSARTFFSDRPVAYHPILAKVVGSVTAALFLSQLAYWSDKGFDKDGWIYKTEAEMEDETGLSRKEQETARKALVWCGVLKEERRGIPARMWYLIDWDALTALLDEYEKAKSESGTNKLPKVRKQVVRNGQTGCAKRTNSTEITTESTHSSQPPPACDGFPKATANADVEGEKTASDLWAEMESATATLGEVTPENAAMGKLRAIVPYAKIGKELRAQVRTLAEADEGLLGLERGLDEFRRVNKEKPYPYVDANLLVGFWRGALNTAHASKEVDMQLPPGVEWAKGKQVFVPQGAAF